MSQRSGELIRVMVVDDHRMFVEALVELLDKETDIEVVGTAGGVEEAVRAAARYAPHVVLIDYKLPDGPGVKAAARIQVEHPDTKIVMLTAFEDEATVLEAVEVGCSAFVTKNKAFAEVVSSVRAAHSGETLLPLRETPFSLKGRRRRCRGAKLTAREVEILKLLVESLSNKAIADQLAISTYTVRNHIQHILTKLNAHSKVEAIAVAVRQGIIHYP